MKLFGAMLIFILLNLSDAHAANSALIWGSGGYAENLAPTGIKTKSGMTIDDNSTNFTFSSDVIAPNFGTAGDIQTFTGTDKEINLGDSMWDILSTGVSEPNGISINADPTKFDIAPTEGYVVDPDSNVYKKVSFAGQTGITPLLATGLSYIFLEPDGSVSQQSSEPSSADRRTKIYLGRVFAISGTISVAFDEPLVTENLASSLYDLAKALRIFNESGNLFTAGGGLTLNKSAGKQFSVGSNYVFNRNQPHSVDINSCTTCTFAYFTQTSGSTQPDTTLVDPANYDVGGVITPIPGANRRATIQRVFLFPSGNIRIQYGQTFYNNISTALENVGKETFTDNPNTLGGVLMALIVARKDATDLTDPSSARILYTSKFGESAIGAAGQSVSSLQDAYDNSIEGEIITDATRLGVKIKDNATSIEAPLFQILSNDELINYFTADLTKLSTDVDMDFNSTGYVRLPVGTDAQRPSTPLVGMTRYNTDQECEEVYNGTEWACKGSGGGNRLQFVENPSFESTKIVFSGGGTVQFQDYAVNTGLYSPTNKKYLEVSEPPLNTFNMVQDIPHDSSLTGKSGILKVWIKTASENLVLSLKKDGVKGTQKGIDALDIVSDDVWREYKIPFVFGATSIGYDINSDVAFAYNIKIDELTIELDSSPLTQIANISEWQGFTPTFEGLGTVSGIEGRYRIVGDSLQISVKATTGTQTATQVKVSLPSGFTISGSYTSIHVAGALQPNLSADAHYSVLATAGEDFFNIGARSVGGGSLYAKLLGSQILSNGTQFSLEATVKVNELQASSIVAIQEKQVNRLTKDSFFIKIGVGGVVEVDDYDIIDGNCALSGINNETKTCTYNTDIFTVAPTPVAVACGTAQDRNVSVGTYTSSSFQFTTRVIINTQADNGACFLIGKRKVDQNKSNILVADIEGINSSDLSLVTSQGTGSGNVSLSANSTNIPFGEGKDINNEWNGTQFEAKRDGFYTFDGFLVLNSSDTSYIKVYINNIDQDKFASQLNVNSTFKKFHYSTYLEVGQKLSFRLSLNNTLINSPRNYLNVSQSADKEAIVENFNKFQEQYFETETQVGLWNGEALYKRCHTVTSDITSSTTLANWGAGLKPKKSNQFFSNSENWWGILSTSSSSAHSIIYYEDTTGQVNSFIASPWKIGAGTSFCMEYTK